MIYQQRYQEALEAFESKEFAKALESFSRLIFDMIIDKDEEEISPIDAMQMVIKAFTQLDKEGVMNQILENEKDNIPEQYFRVIRHYFDNKPATSEEKISQELNREIPINESETREFVFEIGDTTTEYQQVGPYQLAIATAQGPRDEMEDSYLTCEHKVNLSGKHTLYVFAVFDGHAGRGCVEFVEQQLANLLQQEIERMDSLTDLNLYNALVKTFVDLDFAWKNLAFQYANDKDHSGTTATLCMIVDGEDLWVANVGDSSAMISKGGQPIQLAETAKPTNPKYQKEIFFRGGTVWWSRVDGSLDMARSIGDLEHASVSARPTIKKYDLRRLNPKEQNTLVIACDGLWEVVSPKIVVNLIKGKSEEEAADCLRTSAYSRGSWDNVTIVVVNLNVEGA